MKNTKNQVGALVSAIGIERHAAPPQVTGNPLISSGLLKIGFIRSKKLARQDAGAPQPPTPNEPPAARPVPDDCKSIDSTGLIQKWLCSSKKAPDPNLDPQSRPGTGGRTRSRRQAETMNINDLTSLGLFGRNLRASCATAIRLYFHPIGGRRSGHPDATNVTECYANREKRPFVPFSKTPPAPVAGRAAEDPLELLKIHDLTSLALFGGNLRPPPPAQNSSFACTAIIRGELSPPNPTPSSPVGGDVVELIAPKPVCVAGCPGIPATTDGKAKLGWFNTLKNCPSMRNISPSRRRKRLVTYRSLQTKSGPRSLLRPRSPNWQCAGLSPP